MLGRDGEQKPGHLLLTLQPLDVRPISEARVVCVCACVLEKGEKGGREEENSLECSLWREGVVPLEGLAEQGE